MFVRSFVTFAKSFFASANDQNAVAPTNIVVTEDDIDRKHAIDYIEETIINDHYKNILKTVAEGNVQSPICFDDVIDILKSDCFCDICWEPLKKVIERDSSKFERIKYECDRKLATYRTNEQEKSYADFCREVVSIVSRGVTNLIGDDELKEMIEGYKYNHQLVDVYELVGSKESDEELTYCTYKIIRRKENLHFMAKKIRGVSCAKTITKGLRECIYGVNNAGNQLVENNFVDVYIKSILSSIKNMDDEQLKSFTEDLLVPLSFFRQAIVHMLRIVSQEFSGPFATQMQDMTPKQSISIFICFSYREIDLRELNDRIGMITQKHKVAASIMQKLRLLLDFYKDIILLQRIKIIDPKMTKFDGIMDKIETGNFKELENFNKSFSRLFVCDISLEVDTHKKKIANDKTAEDLHEEETICILRTNTAHF